MIIKQSDKKHDANRLHDALNAVKLYPKVFPRTDETEIVFEDPKDEAKAKVVIDAYEYQEPKPMPDLIAVMDRIRTAKTFAEFKEAFIALEEGKHPERKVK